jgi:hypothetical protein
MPSAYAPAPACSFLTRQRVADQPDRRRPQPDEQRTALGVAALVLVDGLGALPPEFPDGVDETEVLGAADGRGPLFHRRYRTQIREARLNASSLMLELKRDVNQAAPTKSSFRLATLEGHLEAGQIEFRVLAAEPMVFEIESWARSADRFADLLYHRARMAKEIQLHMWIAFLEGVSELAGGRVYLSRTPKLDQQSDIYERGCRICMTPTTTGAFVCWARPRPTSPTRSSTTPRRSGSSSIWVGHAMTGPALSLPTIR